MADVKLVVDVDYAPSLSNFQSNISRIVNQINGNPLKIKLRVDAGSFKNDIAQLTNQLRALNNIKVNPFGSGSSGPSGGSSKGLNFVSGTTAYLKEMDRLVNLQKSIQSSLTRYSTMSDDKTVGANYAELATQLEKVKTLMDNLDGKSMKSASKEFAEIKLEADKAVAAISKVVEEQKKSAAGQPISKGSLEYFNALQKIDKAQAQIISNSKKWAAAAEGGTSEAYKNYVSQGEALEKLKTDLENGAVSMEQFKTRLSEIGMNASKVGNEIKSGFSGIDNISNGLKGVTTQLLEFASATRIIMAAMRTVKQMISYSIEIESAMNRIQIVTGASDSQMGAFFETAANNARALGASITDVAGSIETFSRLGYSLGEASELSKYATIMSNVADTNTDAATSGLTSIIKAYGMDVSNVEHVTDVLIQVGQKYAISAEELMTAFERGGSAMAASGTSFEQTAALFAATNASLQNAATTGTLWKTVSARIRSAKTELEEMGEDTSDLADGFSKYRAELQALTGVDIQKNEYEYKDLLTIFTELAQVWDSLDSDMARARVGEILGGTRNQSGIMSTIQNIADAIGAYNDAMNASSVAEEANAKYMETTQAHIDQLKASFQELSHDVFESSFMKVFVDGLRGVVEVIDAIIDKFGALGAVGVSAGIAAIAFNLKSWLTGLPGLISKVGSGIVKVISLIATGSSTAITSLSSIAPQLALIIAGVTALSIAWSKINEKFKTPTFGDLKQTADNSASQYKQTLSDLENINLELENTRAKMSELEGKKLSPVEQAEYDRLVRYNDQLLRQKEILEATAQSQARQSAIDALNALKTETEVEGKYARLGPDVSVENASIWGGGKPSATGTVGQQLSSATKYVDKLKQQAADLQRDIDALSNPIGDGTSEGSFDISKSAEKQLTKKGKELEKLKGEIEAGNKEIDGYVTSINELLTQMYTPEGDFILEGTMYEEEARKIIEQYSEGLDKYIESAEEGSKLRESRIKAVLGIYQQDYSDLVKLASQKQFEGGITADDITSNYTDLATAITSRGMDIQDAVDIINSQADVKNMDNIRNSVRDSINTFVDTESAFQQYSDKLKETDNRIKEIKSQLLADSMAETTGGETMEAAARQKLETELSQLESTRDTYKQLLDGVKNGTVELLGLNEEARAQIVDYFNQLSGGDQNIIYEGLDTGEFAFNGDTGNAVIEGMEAYIAHVKETANEVIELTGELSDIPKIFSDDSAFNKSYESYIKNLDTLRSALDKWNSGDLQLSDMVSLKQQFGELSSYDESNFGAGISAQIEKILGTATKGTGVIELFNRKIAEIGEDTASGQALQQMLQDIIKVYQDSTSALDSAKKQISDATSYQSTLTNAMKDSASATGVSTEEVESLTKAYQGLSGFNPSRLFETTYNGIHLNEEELKRLNAELKETTLQDLYSNLSEQYAQYQATKAAGGDTSGLEADIASTEMLISQYEGMTSAYNAWVNAKSGSNERDSYASVGEAYESMEKILNQGWTGDESLNSYLDLLIGAENRTGDVYAEWAQLNQQIEGTSHSLMDYWVKSDDGLTSIGLFDFLDDVNAKLGDSFASIDENGEYTFDFTGNKLQQVADAFGTSVEMVQLFERAMIDAGFKVQMSDSYLEDLRSNLQGLQSESASGFLDGIDLNFDAANMSLEEFDGKLNELKDRKETISVEAEGTEEFEALTQLIASMESKSISMHINTVLSGGKETVDSLLAMSDEDLSKTLNIDTSQVEAARQSLESLTSEAETASITVTIDQTQFDELTAPDKEATVTYDVNDEAPQAYTPEDKEATVEYDTDTSQPEGYQPSNKTARVTYFAVTSGLPSSFPAITRYVNYVATGNVHTTKADGTLGGSHALGTVSENGSAYNAPLNWRHAYANGHVALDQNEYALVNELGTESIIRDGQWMLLPHGMHQQFLRKGDIILSAAQTRALIQTGAAPGTARAYAFGTLSNAYDRGSGGRRPTISGSTSTYSSSRSSSGSNRYYSAPSYSSSSYDDDDYSSSSSSDDEEEEEREKIDWIEIAIARIERLIENLGRVAESTFKKLAQRLKATDEEIEAIAEEISIQQAGEQRYLEEASSIGLSEDLAEKVRNGTIDINEYDKDTQDLINDYQEWYEKALDCADAVEELHENLASLYQDRFEMVETDFDNQLALLEHLTTTYENGMDDIEERGYLMTTKYYEASRKVQQQNIDILNKELAELIQKMSDGMNSGEIQEGSETWYEMQKSINGVKEAIQEANTEIIRLGNSIRNTNWEHFDYLQERISDITREADFLISLMEHSKLFDDRGQFSSTGMATMGVHGQNYNVYMNQADRYAREIERIKKEIESDPANTDLIERREELLDLQRESILNAEDEKEAIVDLVREGIETELAALNDVIDAYKESLDTAKDLYDYQKKLSNQAKNVASIQKQLAAYAGDNSEESRATIQRLNAKLGDAMEKLEETERERTIKEQKAMLDNLYSEYESILNERLDNVDALISDMIDTINENASNINDTLISESHDVGYTISDSMRSIWASGGEASSVITKYGDSFLSEMTSVNAVLNGIAANVARMIAASDTTAQEVISTTTATTQPNKAPEKPKATTPTAPAKPAGPSDQDYYGVAFAIWEGIYGWGAGDERVARLKAKGFDAAKVQSIVNSVYSDYMNDRFSKYGISSDLSKYAYNKYLHGGLVKYTGLAQVDGSPSAPESFLDAKDTANLAKLTEVMKQNGTFGIGNKLGIHGLRAGLGADGFGDVIYNINIPIDHVSDYNDFMNQMRQDNKFEKFVQSVTIGRVNGENRLSKNKYTW